MKPFLIISFAFLILSGVLGPGGFKNNMIHNGLFAAGALFCAILGGTVLHPLLLPYLPGRAFSVKGFFVGLVIALELLYLRDLNLHLWADRTEVLAWLLIIPAISAYLAMNFTGCSTYTSLSGVKKEMRFALPLEMTAGMLGLVVWITSLMIA